MINKTIFTLLIERGIVAVNRLINGSDFVLLLRKVSYRFKTLQDYNNLSTAALAHSFI